MRIGIAENAPTLFSDPLFQALGAKYARVGVSRNVTTRGHDELQRVADYLGAARAAGVQPLVTFEHARGAAEICNRRANRRKQQCRLPTPKQYERNFKRFTRALKAREAQPAHQAPLHPHVVRCGDQALRRRALAHGKPRSSYYEVKKRLR